MSNERRASGLGPSMSAARLEHTTTQQSQGPAATIQQAESSAAAPESPDRKRPRYDTGMSSCAAWPMRRRWTSWKRPKTAPVGPRGESDEPSWSVKARDLIRSADLRRQLRITLSGLVGALQATVDSRYQTAAAATAATPCERGDGAWQCARLASLRVRTSASTRSV